MCIRDSIYIDGYFKLVLYKGEIRKLNLKHNSEIDEEVYYYIIKDILVKRARLRALHILEKREYTKKQLTDKLKQNEYPDIVIEDAIDYVESYNYINDERYAMQYLRCGLSLIHILSYHLIQVQILPQSFP